MSYKHAGFNLAATTAMWSLPQFDADTPPEMVGALAVETCTNLRILGILAWLDEKDEQQFLANLSRSARAWVMFLGRAKEVDPRPHHYVSGRIDPILDGIAAGDMEAIARIAELAPAEKQGRSEYEDDYCYARLLMGLSSTTIDKDGLVPLVGRYRRFEDGARAGACAALLDADKVAFNRYLRQVIANFKKAADELYERTEDSPELTARCSVCVEGLALLRLAAKLSIPAGAKYPLCPNRVRVPFAGPFPEEFLI
jgi:hypothetical protein